MKVIAMMVLTTSTSILYMVLKFILAALGVTHVLLPIAIIGVIITESPRGFSNDSLLFFCLV